MSATPNTVLLEDTLKNLKVKNAEEIRSRRDEITKALNKRFRELDGSSNNSLMIGSYGRHTAINGISDLDMVYIMPSSLRNVYRSQDGPYKALRHCRDAIIARYPKTSVIVSSPVVVVEFSNFKFEVQPVFQDKEGTFFYPDTTRKLWKPAKTRQEIAATKEMNDETSGILRKLCRLARSWKHKHAVAMGGLLIDTLVFNYLDGNAAASDGELSIEELLLGFFTYLSNEPKRKYYLAMGSNQKVRVKTGFQHKAKAAEKICREGIEGESAKSNWKVWRSLLGKAVPVDDQDRENADLPDYVDTEQFIEDYYPQDIRYTLDIDCDVISDEKSSWLSDWLRKHVRLPLHHKLLFKVTFCDVPEPFAIKWKVLNRGQQAQAKNMIRGTIIDDGGSLQREEKTDFQGDHYVECYAIKDDIVVARDHISVPIN